MPVRGYPTSGSQLGVYPESGSRFGSYPSGLSAITISQRVVVDSVLSFSSYSPLSEGGGVFWLDMLDAASYTVSGGTTVTAFTNKVSSVSWPAVSSCPYEATGLNSKPCLHPTTISHYFLSTEATVVSALDCASASKPYTIYILEIADSATGGGVIVGSGNSGVASASTRTWGRRVGVSQYEYAQTAPASVGTIRSTGAVSTSLAVSCWHSPGVGVKHSLNNATDDPNNATLDPAYVPGTGPNRVALFCRPDSTPDTPNTGSKVGEILICSTEHDAAARARVCNYLLARWS